MGNVIRLPYSHTAEPASPYPRRANVGMADAPRDGTKIWVMVAGPVEGVSRAHREHTRHWLRFPVRWFGGRWCYALHNTPLFAWHEPLGWQDTKPEGIE